MTESQDAESAERSAADRLNLVGEDCFTAGDVDQAIAAFQEAIAHCPEHAGAHANLGVVYWHLGENTKAVQHLLQAFRADAGDRTTALNLGKALCGNRQYLAASHMLGTFLHAVPDAAEVRELMEASTAWAREAQVSAASPESPALPRRIPEMNDSLRTLLALGVEVKSVLDVGVMYGTDALMHTFPYLRHYLFEPIDDHFETIKKNYARMDYRLFHVALSNADGQAWQSGVCNNATGLITHSELSDAPVTREQNPRLIDCRPIRKARLDTLIAGLDPPTPYLLKIDVDGHEIPVLEGARETLRNASIVVIEATATALLERAQFLAACGFRLFDIVNPAYYSGVLHQVDLIFVRSDLVERNPRLRPMQQQVFQPDQWYSVSSQCFEQ